MSVGLDFKSADEGMYRIRFSYVVIVTILY